MGHGHRLPLWQVQTMQSVASSDQPGGRALVHPSSSMIISGCGMGGAPSEGPHRRTDGQELDHVAAPEVRVLDELHPDDPLATKLPGLFLHAGHGQLPGFVEGLGEVGEFRVPHEGLGG